jgi:hypothetical protein
MLKSADSGLAFEFLAECLCYNQSNRKLGANMSETITDKLNRLADFQAQKDMLNLEKQELINQVIPPEIRARLEEIEAEFAGRAEAVILNIDLLEMEIREDVLDCQKSTAGSFLQAIWNRGRKGWDSSGLEQYAKDHPEILSYRKLGEPYITIRKI